MHGWLLPLAWDLLPVGIHFILHNLNGIPHTRLCFFPHCVYVSFLWRQRTLLLHRLDLIDNLLWSSSLVPSRHQLKKKPSEAHHLPKCEEVSRPTSDPRPFEPVFNSSIIPAFLCTSLLSSSCHFYPHFLTPSWLLWPLNVSRWQDTTPTVIHPALSDHCVSALVNTDPPAPHPSLFQAVVPLNDLEGEGRLSVHSLTI